MAIFAIALLTLLTAPPQIKEDPRMFPSWVWASRLDAETDEYPTGYSHKAILAMGNKRWHQVCQIGADFPDIVFAKCLLERNIATLAYLPSAKKNRIEQTRVAVWLTANACIALEHNESGGGTASVHNPRYVRVELEQLTYNLATTRVQAVGPSVQKLMPRLRRELSRRATATSWPAIPVIGKPPSLPEERKYGRLALRYFDEAVRLSKQFGPAERQAILRIVEKWSVGLHAPGLPPEK